MAERMGSHRASALDSADRQGTQPLLQVLPTGGFSVPTIPQGQPREEPGATGAHF